MSRVFRGMPAVLMVLFCSLATLPFWSMTFLPPPWILFANGATWQTALLGATYWVLPWLVCAALLTRSLLAMFGFVLLCVGFLLHATVLDASADGVTMAIRVGLLTAVCGLGATLLRRDILFPFLSPLSRFWRHNRRVETNRIATIVLPGDAAPSIRCIVSNYSATGFGVIIADAGADLAERLVGTTLAVTLEGEAISCQCIWTAPHGRVLQLGLRSVDEAAMRRLQATFAENDGMRPGFGRTVEHLLARTEVRRSLAALWGLSIVGSGAVPACGTAPTVRSLRTSQSATAGVGSADRARLTAASETLAAGRGAPTVQGAKFDPDAWNDEDGGKRCAGYAPGERPEADTLGVAYTNGCLELALLTHGSTVRLVWSDVLEAAYVPIFGSELKIEGSTATLRDGPFSKVYRAAKSRGVLRFYPNPRDGTWIEVEAESSRGTLRDGDSVTTFLADASAFYRPVEIKTLGGGADGTGVTRKLTITRTGADIQAIADMHGHKILIQSQDGRITQLSGPTALDETSITLDDQGRPTQVTVRDANGRDVHDVIDYQSNKLKRIISGASGKGFAYARAVDGTVKTAGIVQSAGMNAGEAPKTIYVRRIAVCERGENHTTLVTDPLGTADIENTTTYVYARGDDGRQLLKQIKSPLGKSTRLTYEGTLLTKVLDDKGVGFLYDYHSGTDRIAKAVHAKTNRVAYQTTLAAAPTAVVDRLLTGTLVDGLTSVTTSFTYDAAGRVVRSTTGPKATTIEYAGAKSGGTLVTTRRGGLISTLELNAFGLPVGKRATSGATSTLRYDQDRAVATESQPQNVRETVTYDESSRMTAVERSVGPFERRSYANGALPSGSSAPLTTNRYERYPDGSISLASNTVGGYQATLKRVMSEDRLEVETTLNDILLSRVATPALPAPTRPSCQ